MNPGPCTSGCQKSSGLKIRTESNINKKPNVETGRIKEIMEEWKRKEPTFKVMSRRCAFYIYKSKTIHGN